MPSLPGSQGNRSWTKARASCDRGGGGEGCHAQRKREGGAVERSGPEEAWSGGHRALAPSSFCAGLEPRLLSARALLRRLPPPLAPLPRRSRPRSRTLAARHRAHRVGPASAGRALGVLAQTTICPSVRAPRTTMPLRMGASSSDRGVADFIAPPDRAGRACRAAVRARARASALRRAGRRSDAARTARSRRARVRARAAIRVAPRGLERRAQTKRTGAPPRRARGAGRARGRRRPTCRGKGPGRTRRRGRGPGGAGVASSALSCGVASPSARATPAAGRALRAAGGPHSGRLGKRGGRGGTWQNAEAGNGVRPCGLDPVRAGRRRHFRARVRGRPAETPLRRRWGGERRETRAARCRPPLGPLLRPPAGRSLPLPRRLLLGCA